MRQFKANLKKIEKLAEDVFRYDFDFVNDPVPFDAGQFFMIDILDGRPEKAQRAYSTCSAPNPEYFSLCIKLVAGGRGSNYFSNLKVGDECSFTGPYGRFVLQENGKDVLMISTGTGIAPFMAMIEVLWANNFKKPVTLYFGVAGQSDLFFVDTLKKWEAEHDNFTLNICLSRPEAGWKGLKGRVTAHLDDAILDPANTSIYLCGNGDMIKEVREMMLTRGVAKEDINFEQFWA